MFVGQVSRVLVATIARGSSIMPTFEERYGPWICCGCGRPHATTEDCPTHSAGRVDADRPEEQRPDLTPTQHLAQLLEESGAIPVIDGIPCNEHTRRAFCVGRSAGLEAAEAKLRELSRHRSLAGAVALRAAADVIAAMVKESASGQ